MTDKQIYLAYAGARPTLGKRGGLVLSHEYFEVVNSGEKGDPWFVPGLASGSSHQFERQLIKGQTIGSVMEATQVNIEKGFAIGKREIIPGEYVRESTRLLWEVRTEADKTFVEQERAAARENKRTLLTDHLAPVKAEYNRLSRAERRALLAWIITYLEA